MFMGAQSLMLGYGGQITIEVKLTIVIMRGK